MKQIFALFSDGETLDFEKEDGLPLSERLLPEISRAFGLHLRAPAAQALEFLRNFYSHYELSQPQRRIWLRFEKKLSEISAPGEVQFLEVEVSERRSRRNSKKNQQFY